MTSIAALTKLESDRRIAFDNGVGARRAISGDVLGVSIDAPFPTARAIPGTGPERPTRHRFTPQLGGGYRHMT